MSTTAESITEHGSAAHTAALRARFAPILERLADGVVARDAARELPLVGVAELAAAGFGSLRVPVEFGGEGVSLEQLFELLTDVATADPNAAQALRGHLAFVEDRLVARPDASRQEWFARFVAGELAGNAWTDAAAAAQGVISTQLTRSGEDWVLNGTKFYSTGSLFAQWIDVYAYSPELQADVIALVRTDQPGAALSDDWNGFGQRTTGTGTTVFTDAVVKTEDVILAEHRFGYQTAYYQQVLLATLAGIARSAANEISGALRGRARGYSHGAAATPANDPQLLAVVGEADAVAFAAAAVVTRASQALDAAADAALARWDGGALEVDYSTSPQDEEAELATARGQVVLSRLVPESATRIFDALGASGTDTGKGLDRHWRNARTVSSHNPWVYKARVLGDAAVNGAIAPKVWSVGTAVPQKTA